MDSSPSGAPAPSPAEPAASRPAGVSSYCSCVLRSGEAVLGCPDCGGTGRRTVAGLIERPCFWCNGEGSMLAHGGSVPCFECDGTGRIRVWRGRRA
jgi:DnaJ-class molecular chaperone